MVFGITRIARTSGTTVSTAFLTNFVVLFAAFLIPFPAFLTPFFNFLKNPKLVKSPTDWS